MGSKSSNGSPGKYIWATSRSANVRPKTEKWIWAGRQALRCFRHGQAPGRRVVKRQSPAASATARPARHLARVPDRHGEAVRVGAGSGAGGVRAARSTDIRGPSRGGRLYGEAPRYERWIARLGPEVTNAIIFALFLVTA